MRADTYRKTMVAFAFVALLAAIAAFAYASSRIRAPTCPIARCPAVEVSVAAAPPPSRDRRVVEDPLYPPLNRSPASPEDAFRLIGYLTSEAHAQDAGNNRWKLFGRMKDRHEGEYYVSPVDKTIDLKVPLTRETVVGERLRDVYTLPNQMRFKSPMLHETPYAFTELPKAELGSSSYV